MLNLSLIAAFINTTLLLCFRKWGWLGWYQVYRKRWMPEGDCYLCLSFWLAMAEIGIWLFFWQDWELLMLPFVSCSLSNLLIKLSID